MQDVEIKVFQSYLYKNKEIEKNKAINRAIYNLFESEKENMIEFITRSKEDEIKLISSSSDLKEISNFFV